MKTNRILYLLFAVVALFNMYCSPPVTPSENTSEKTTQGDASSGDKSGEPNTADTGSDASAKEEVPEEPKKEKLFARPDSGWCSRMATGSQGAKSIALDLSMAHSKLRFFGVHKGYPHVDALLVQALDANSLESARVLSGYQQDSDICVLSVEKPALGRIKVTMKGDVAHVTPGTGELKLPANTRAVVLDFRNLGADEGVEKVLLELVSQLLTKPVALPDRTVIWHKGMKDEVFSPQNAYNNLLTTLRGTFIPAKGNKAYPLAIVLGKVVSPAAARVAGALRWNRRAWIIGEDIPTAVAESRWQSVGSAGIAFRTMELSYNSSLWPDIIMADKSMEQMDSFLKTLSGNPPIPSLTNATPKRSRLKPHHYFQKFHSQTPSKSTLQAALLIAHGALRAFYPYFATVGDTIDARLKETLQTSESLVVNGFTTRNLLRRFGEAIKDGHCFVSYRGRSNAKGFLLVELDKLGGKPVIRHTSHPGLKVGDTILSIHGTTAEEWFKNEYKRTSAATPGYLFDLAARELNVMYEDMKMEVQSVDGSKHSVSLKPQNYEAYRQFLNKKFRQAGFLKDYKADDILYVDLDGNSMKKTDFNSVLQMMQKAKAVVLDMRGYPGQNSWKLIQHIATKPLPSPLFSTPNWKGASQVKRDVSKYDLPMLSPQFKGKVAFLIGPRSVSSAEHVSTMLQQAGRVTFIGRTTAGTNGNITGLVLPGLLTFTFTGMEILYRDQKRFHGVGIIPDIKISPTAQELAQGRDPVLKKAVEFLQKR